MFHLRKPLPLDGSIQAEYKDGFVLDETALKDTNPFGEGNTLRAILNKDAEAKHGPMVRFTVFYKDNRWDIDWTTMPESARPIRFKDMQRKDKQIIDTGEIIEAVPELLRIRFGFQYTDDNGKNQQIIQEVE